LNIKLHFLSDDLETIYKKARYQDLFDVAVLSINSATRIKEEGFKVLLKEDAKIYVENAKFFVLFKAEQKKSYDTKLQEYATEGGFKNCPSNYDHHHCFMGNK
jgi:hypothetical protein